MWLGPLPALGSAHTETVRLAGTFQSLNKIHIEMAGLAGPSHSFECFLILKWLVWLDPLTVLNDFSIEMAGLAGPSHSFE